MMDSPTLPELIGSVREFLEGPAMAQLQGHTAYHAKVAVNVLRIAERELLQGAGVAALERERLGALLGEPADDLERLNRTLCEAIRSGGMTSATPGLVDHLLATAIDKVAIDQPGYSGLAVARAEGRLLG